MAPASQLDTIWTRTCFSYTANNISIEPPRYLDPHGRGVGGVGAEVAAGVRLVPVGEGHHDVERGQGEHHVEHGPGVSNLHI